MAYEEEYYNGTDDKHFRYIDCWLKYIKKLSDL